MRKIDRNATQKLFKIRTPVQLTVHEKRLSHARSVRREWSREKKRNPQSLPVDDLVKGGE